MFESVRNVLALTGQNELKFHQIDVKTASPNDNLEEGVYMVQPEVFIVKGKEKFACKLNDVGMIHYTTS